VCVCVCVCVITKLLSDKLTAITLVSVFDKCWCECFRRSDYGRGHRGGRNAGPNFPKRRDDVADKLVNQLQGLVSALTYVPAELSTNSCVSSRLGV